MEYLTRNNDSKISLSIEDGKITKVTIAEGNNLRETYKAKPQGFEQKLTTDIYRKAITSMFFEAVEGEGGLEMLEDVLENIEDEKQQDIIENLMFNIIDICFHLVDHLPNSSFKEFVQQMNEACSEETQS